MNDESWGRIASLHAPDANLDTSSAALIGSKNPTAADAGRITRSKAIVENPLLRVMRNLARSIAEDTVRNEYLLHARIHEWLANSSAPAEADQFNAKVYAELFLTPDADPWLGLVPGDTFTALENNGLIRPTGNSPERPVSARPTF